MKNEVKEAVKEPLTRAAIMDGFKSLARSQGLYGRLIRDIENASEETREGFWQEIEAHKFTDFVDVILWLEQ